MIQRGSCSRRRRRRINKDAGPYSFFGSRFLSSAQTTHDFRFTVFFYHSITTPRQLMGNARNLLWFQCCVWLELLVQLPFFFWACQVLSSTTTTKKYPKRFGQASIAYAGHACTSMVPILATLATNPAADLTQKTMILSVYLPYLIFPLALLFYATRDDEDEDEGAKSQQQQQQQTKKQS